MNEKYLNFLIFLIDEEQKEAEKIRREYLDRGIDLEKEKQKILKELNEIKAELRKEKAREFKNYFTRMLVFLNDTNFISNNLNNHNLAFRFRRNKDQKPYELKKEDMEKLKLIKLIREKNKSEFKDE